MAVNLNTNLPATEEDRREEARFGAYTKYYKEKWELVSDLELQKIKKATNDKDEMYFDDDNPKAAVIAHMEAQLDLMKAERRKRLQEFKVSMVAKYRQGKAGRREMVVLYSSTFGEDTTFPIYDYQLFEKRDYHENEGITGLFKAGKEFKAESKEKKEKGEIPFMKEKGEIRLVETKMITAIDLMYVIDDVFDENCGQIRYLLWVEKLCSGRKKNKLPHSDPLKPNSLRRKINICISVIGAGVAIAIAVA